MKSILQSIKPQYCELIASGKKTVEVRKTRPELDVPFKAYIYCTKDGFYGLQSKSNPALKTNASGKVIGEYVCKKIDKIVHAATTNSNIELCFCRNGWYYTPLTADFHRDSCLSYAELEKYSNGRDIYVWHISDLKIYNKPKELKEFYKPCGIQNCIGCRFWFDDGKEFGCKTKQMRQLTHPPQSWCYVEEV